MLEPIIATGSNAVIVINDGKPYWAKRSGEGTKEIGYTRLKAFKLSELMHKKIVQCGVSKDDSRQEQCYMRTSLDELYIFDIGLFPLSRSEKSDFRESNNEPKLLAKIENVTACYARLNPKDIKGLWILLDGEIWCITDFTGKTKHRERESQCLPGSSKVKGVKLLFPKPHFTVSQMIVWHTISEYTNYRDGYAVYVINEKKELYCISNCQNMIRPSEKINVWNKVLQNSCASIAHFAYSAFLLANLESGGYCTIDTHFGSQKSSIVAKDSPVSGTECYKYSDNFDSSIWLTPDGAALVCKYDSGFDTKFKYCQKLKGYRMLNSELKTGNFKHFSNVGWHLSYIDLKSEVYVIHNSGFGVYSSLKAVKVPGLTVDVPPFRNVKIHLSRKMSGAQGKDFSVQ